jgi:acetylornithine deacetylase
LKASIDQTRQLLSRLVRCPSVNPAGCERFEPPFGESQMAQLLAELLRSWGAAVQIAEAAPGRPNVLARFEGPAGAPTLAFECHTDTVSIEGMTVAPFDAIVRDGKLYGRGACDDKGPMTAMLLAIRGLLDAGPLPVNLLFVGACGEELGAMGAKALVASGLLKADALVVGEPTDMQIVHASKGVVRFRIETHGRAAHSSEPARGVNAIYQMRRVLQVLEDEVAPRLEAKPHPLLGPPRMSVGTIAGGTQVNIVPDRCEILVDRRTLPGEKLAAVAAQVLEPLERLKQQVPNFQYAAEYAEQFPPLWTDAQAPLARLVKTACENTMGRGELTVAPWASDAAVYAAAGMPALLLGPGAIGQAHTVDEYIELDAVARAAETYAEIVRLYGRLETRDA